MSVNEEIQVAYDTGVRNGIKLGQKQGAAAAYADLQSWALERLENVAPYSDTRTAQDLLDYCNARLSETAVDGVPSIDRKEGSDGTQPEAGHGQ